MTEPFGEPEPGSQYNESVAFMRGLLIGLTASSVFIGVVVLIVVAFLL